MELHITYFGLLTEITSCTTEKIIFKGKTASDLIAQLYLKYPLLKNSSFKIAQNLEIINNDETIISSSIVLLPPFSGG